MQSIEKIITEEIEVMLNEIGEGNVTPYEYTKEVNPEYLSYKFTTEDNDVYDVKIRKDAAIANALQAWIVEFSVVDTEYKHFDVFKQVVNKGKFFKVMSTVGIIVKKFAAEYNPDIMIFIPSQTKGDEDFRRFDIYSRFIKSNILPNYTINDYIRENVIFVVNNNIFDKSEEELRKIQKVLGYQLDHAQTHYAYERLKYLNDLLIGHIKQTYGRRKK